MRSPDVMLERLPETEIAGSLIFTEESGMELVLAP